MQIALAGALDVAFPKSRGYKRYSEHLFFFNLTMSSLNTKSADAEESFLNMRFPNLYKRIFSNFS